MDKMISLTIGVEDDPHEWRMLFNELSLQAARLGSKYPYVNVSSSQVNADEEPNDPDLIYHDDQLVKLHYDDMTLTKVQYALEGALNAAGYYNKEVVLNCISAMQNAGILFRERA